MLVQCPGCSVKLKIDDDDKNVKIECPKCDKSFIPGKLAVSAAKPVSAPKKASRRQDDEDDDNDDDDDDRPRKKKKAKKEEKGFPVVPVAIGGGVGILAIAGIVIALTSGDGGKRDKASTTQPAATQQVSTPTSEAPATTKPTESTPTTTKPTTPATTKPTTPPTIKKKEDPLAYLFAESISFKPPTIKAAKLIQKDQDIKIEVPTFHSLRVAQSIASPRAVSKAANMTLEECKAATVYVEVDLGELGGSSGSGFLIGVIGNTGYIATNHHVIRDVLGARRRPGAKISVKIVFNANQEGEHVHPVDIVAYDPIGDLAILKFNTEGKKMPKILDPYAAPVVRDDMKDIRVLGFPLGATLKVEGTKYPTMTKSTVEVSAIRKNKQGKIDDIQLAGGSVTHGNSGGPVVDSTGRLIGILYAGHDGTTISFCIPVEKLIALIEGRLLNVRFIPTGLDDSKAKFMALLPVMDPFDNVSEMYLRWWSGTGKPPKITKDPKKGHAPMMGPGTDQVKLQLFNTNVTSLAYGLGEFKLNTGGEAALIQVASLNNLKITAASAPVEYSLDVKDLVVPTDTLPLNTLTDNPESHVGKVMILRGIIAEPPAKTRRSGMTLRIVSLQGEVPKNVRFVTSKDFAPHFDEVEQENHGLPVRLTCLVGKKGADDIYPVRVERVDFIDNEFGNQEYITQTIPSATSDPTFLLNRDPSKYLGQSLEVTAYISFKPAKNPDLPAGRFEIGVVYPGLFPPRNLVYTVDEDMIKKIFEDRPPRGTYRAKMAVKVDTKVGANDKPTRVDIMKIQLLDHEGKPVKAYE